MAEYYPDGVDGDAHAKAKAETKTEAVRKAFQETVRHHRRDDITVANIRRKGMNPEFSHNIPSWHVEIEYVVGEIPNAPVVEPRTKTILTSVKGYHNGEVVTFDDEVEPEDMTFEASVIDNIRYLE